MKRIVILGAGESGAGASVLAKKERFDVFVSDMSAIKDNYKKLMDGHNVEWEEGQHTEEKILNADEIIKSPGIPESAPMIVKIKEKQIPIISEIEFAGRYSKSKMICITGSNGKTTTTMLIYHILQKAGLKVGLAGNVGFSLARQVAYEDFDYYVIELSSFQLDGMYDFKADVAILLNITPDHLDRYEYKFQNYIDAKMRITRNQTKDDVFIYWNDDENIKKELSKLVVNAKQHAFSLEKAPNTNAYVEDQNITINTENNQLQMNSDSLSLKGTHNIYNSMAAALSASALYIKNEYIRESLMDFEGVEHRLEPVARVKGAIYINDSKATNVNSCWYALESIKTPVVLILGGTDTGNDYNEILSLVKEKVRALVFLGKDNEKLEKFFYGVKPFVSTDSMESAVNECYRLAEKGDTVLLSPCCASFDLFKNYEDRGRIFKQCVKNL